MIQSIRHILRLGFLAAVVICGLTGFTVNVSADWRDDYIAADGSTEDIGLGDVPGKVKKAAKKQLKNLELTGAQVKTVGFSKLYILRGKAKGKSYEITVTDTGKVRRIERRD